MYLGMSTNQESTVRILEAFSYIAERMPANKKNMYNVLKVFYLADKIHMDRYGRFIFDDRYSAMPKGPVPSQAYDLMKSIRRGGVPMVLNSPVTLSEDHTVTPLREANLDIFSGSDLLCLNEIIQLSEQNDLGEYSHDDAWGKTSRNQLMADEDILATLTNSESLLDLHQNRHA